MHCSIGSFKDRVLGSQLFCFKGARASRQPAGQLLRPNENIIPLTLYLAPRRPRSALDRVRNNKHITLN